MKQRRFFLAQLAVSIVQAIADVAKRILGRGCVSEEEGLLVTIQDNNLTHSGGNSGAANPRLDPMSGWPLRVAGPRSRSWRASARRLVINDPWPRANRSTCARQLRLHRNAQSIRAGYASRWRRKPSQYHQGEPSQECEAYSVARWSMSLKQLQEMIRVLGPRFRVRFLAKTG